MKSAAPLRPTRTTSFIQLVGFLRKELLDMLRQPRLLVVLVAGPFLILMLFAAGYDQQSVVLRTIFVGPEGGIYESAIASYEDDIREYVEVLEYTTDILAARNALENGSADVIVVFPPDPSDTVLAGEQAVITVLHDKLDPIQQTAVEVSAEVAVNELNTAVLERLVAEAQATLVPLEASVDEAKTLVDALNAAAEAGDVEGVESSSRDLRASLSAVDRITEVSSEVLGQLDPEADPDQTDRVERLRTTVADLRRTADEVDAAEDAAELRRASAPLPELSERLGADASDVLTIDPAVATRPFIADTENLLRQATRVNDFFAPSAVALLIQHLAITLGALTLVRDHGLGLFETFRVAPIASRQILAGKYLAFLIFSGVAAAVLVAGIVLGLDVPLRGSVASVAGALALLAVASIGFGLVLSALARSDTQAVQYAMLALLASMFFGGFFLSLDAFRFPIRLVSWVLPITYAIRWLQDVMLRGENASTEDIVGLVGLTLAYGAAAWFLFSRRLAVR